SNTPRLRGPVCDEITTNLAFRRLDRVVVITNGRLHDLRQLRVDRTVGKVFQSLVDDPPRLSHLLESHEISIVRIAVLTNRNIEIHVAIRCVWSRLPHVPRDSGTTQRRT